GRPERGQGGCSWTARLMVWTKSCFILMVSLIFSSGVRAERKHNSAGKHRPPRKIKTLHQRESLTLIFFDDVRLVGGASRCAGILEVKHLGDWRPVDFFNWTLKAPAVVCEHLDCGSALTFRRRPQHPASVWKIKPDCCGGHESALLDCRSSGSARTSCSPGKAVGLTCSEPADVRFVPGASRCSDGIEVNVGKWRRVLINAHTLKQLFALCEHLDCGFFKSKGSFRAGPQAVSHEWLIKLDCTETGSPLRECLSFSNFYISPNVFPFNHLTCSGKHVKIQLT
uniref:SRCR domain-containing protein n=1 Tax=Amphilophus citrinellus TaxID=61819 RepID=A0A3Q0R604_AMPCI